MDYEDMIEAEAVEKEKAAHTDAIADVEIEPVETQAAKTPWKLLLATGLLSGLIGVGGGAYGVYTGLKTQAPDISAVTAAMSEQIDSFETRVSSAETLARKASNRKIETAAPVDLSGIEARLESLEAAPKPEIDPEALTALQAAQADGFDWPDVTELETRIGALEQKAAMAPADTETGMAQNLTQDLTDRLETLETDFLAANIGDRLSSMDAERAEMIEARLSALEAREPTVQTVKHVPILAFPKEAMIKAVEANRKGGFIEKTLSKHVRVKDEDNPMTLIDGIETDISEGRLGAATKKYERLPEPVRAAGRAWYESVKTSL